MVCIHEEVSFLKKTSDGPVLIHKMIHARTGGMESARSRKQLHASDLTREDPEFCPRERVLMVRLDKKKPDQMINTALRITFDLGNAMQARFNNVWLRDRMFGEWRCTNPGGKCHSYVGVGLDTCPDCVMGTMVYRELGFKHKTIKRLSGAVDALIDVGENEKYLMVEYKTIDKDEFKKLQMPLSEHRTRTQFYLKLIAESTSPFRTSINTDEARVLYHAKAYGMKTPDGEYSPFKEYIVKRDDSQVEHLFAMADAASKGIHGGDMPTGICSTMTCPRAKVCPVRIECFSGEWG